MRKWWKIQAALAGGLLGLGVFLSPAAAQFEPPPGPPQDPPGAFAIAPGSAGGTPAMLAPDFPNPAQPCKEAVPFSLREGGMPNAFNTCTHDEDDFVNWQFSLGYSFIWFSKARFPPLVTTGSINDTVPGALGQPGTVILSPTNTSPERSNGYFVNAVYWWKDAQVFNLDTSFFMMETSARRTHFASDANGNPVLARPYFNPVAGQEDADPRALPGILTGTLNDAVITRLMGAESNVKWYSFNNFKSYNVCVFGGVRWLALDDKYSSFDTTSDVGGPLTTNISDTFTTYNRFVGPQAGFEVMYKSDGLTLSLLGKVAVGPNIQTVNISGQTVQSDASAGTVITDNRQGLFAQPSNIGVYHAVKAAILPEVAVKASFDLTDRLRLNASYSFFLLSNTVRSGDQIDRNVNIQPLLSGGGIPPALPGPPSFKQSNFTVQMLNLGLEFLF